MKEAIQGRLPQQGDREQEPTSTQTSSRRAYKTLEVDRIDKKIVRILINRPKVNAINGEVLDELDSILSELWNDETVNVLIIGGMGNVFSAGADLSTFFNGGFQFLEFSKKGQRVFKRLTEIPKVTIASIKGYALGGAFELALACDLRVSAPDADIGFPEVTRGLVPAWGGTQRLPKLVGASRALDLILTGRRIKGAEASLMGIVNRVAQNDVDAEALSLAQEISSNVAPVAVALAKRLVIRGAEVSLDDGFEMESMAAGVVYGTEDLREGISAFLEKRKAEYRGR